MIRCFDSRLIAVHQWFVDLTQREPGWLGKQCAIALGVLVIVRDSVFNGFDWLTAVGLGSAALLWFFAGGRSWTRGVPGLFRACFVSMLVLRLVAFAALLFLGAPIHSVGIIGLLTDALLISYAYFASCRPPRPRVPRPRGRLVHGGAA